MESRGKSANGNGIGELQLAIVASSEKWRVQKMLLYAGPEGGVVSCPIPLSFGVA